jgi:hypothetical protein
MQMEIKQKKYETDWKAKNTKDGQNERRQNGQI